MARKKAADGTEVEEDVTPTEEMSVGDAVVTVVKNDAPPEPVKKPDQQRPKVRTKYVV